MIDDHAESSIESRTAIPATRRLAWPTRLILPQLGWRTRRAGLRHVTLGLLSGLATLIVAGAGVWLAVTVGRQLFDSALARLDRDRFVHMLELDAGRPVVRQVPDQLELVFTTQDGGVVRALPDRMAYSAFLKETFAWLEAERQAADAEAARIAQESLDPLQADMTARVPDFGVWYFAWGTNWQIAFEAVKSFGTHVAAVEVDSLRNMIEHDFRDYVMRHYRDIVLYPEGSDFRLRGAFAEAGERMQQRYLRTLANLDQRFQLFVAAHTTHHADAPPGHIASSVQLDWGTEAHKLRIAQPEFPRPLLIGADLLVGGMVMTQAMRMIPGQIVESLGESTLRLGAAAAEGGAAGSVPAPVVGTTIGVIVGLTAAIALDYATNRLIAWTNREAFEADVRRSVTTTFDELKTLVAERLRANSRTRYEDVIQLLGSYPK
jgi:hypothetical protein